MNKKPAHTAEIRPELSSPPLLAKDLAVKFGTYTLPTNPAEIISLTVERAGREVTVTAVYRNNKHEPALTAHHNIHALFKEVIMLEINNYILPDVRVMEVEIKPDEVADELRVVLERAW